ncbi:MAG: aquaporin family protein [Methanomassiliicoccales archaeon]|nr:aquaporin family protein [Methanomassiliicoccales archaeon]
MPTLKQNLLAEFMGSLFLVVVAIGSTILPMTLPGATIALAVFINAVAVAMVLFALIETFGSISGAHFNPAVTLALLSAKQIAPRKASYYIIAQLAGGFIGLLVVGLMFFDYDSTIITVSGNVKNYGQVFAEFIGTFILIGVIIGCVRGSSKHTGLSVGFVVGGMLITTASTMYANPMVSFARMFTYAICGIAPCWAALFVIAEVIGALGAAYVFGIMFPTKLKEKCDPFECPPKKPIAIAMEAGPRTEKCSPYECPKDSTQK